MLLCANVSEQLNGVRDRLWLFDVCPVWFRPRWVRSMIGTAQRGSPRASMHNHECSLPGRRANNGNECKGLTLDIRECVPSRERERAARSPRRPISRGCVRPALFPVKHRAAAGGASAHLRTDVPSAGRARRAPSRCLGLRRGFPRPPGIGRPAGWRRTLRPHAQPRGPLVNPELARRRPQLRRQRAPDRSASALRRTEVPLHSLSGGRL
jgi:hypothetical protein